MGNEFNQAAHHSFEQASIAAQNLGDLIGQVIDSEYGVGVFEDENGQPLIMVKVSSRDTVDELVRHFGNAILMEPDDGGDPILLPLAILPPPCMMN